MGEVSYNSFTYTPLVVLHRGIEMEMIRSLIKAFSCLLVLAGLYNPANAATYQLKISGKINGVGVTSNDDFDNFNSYFGLDFTSTYLLTDEGVSAPGRSDTRGSYNGVIQQASFSIGDVFKSEFTGTANNSIFRIDNNFNDANGDGTTDDILHLRAGEYNSGSVNNFNTSKEPDGYNFSLNTLTFFNDAGTAFDSTALNLANILFDAFYFINSEFRFINETSGSLVFLSGSPTSLALQNVNDISTVPLPAGVWLFGSALVGFGFMRRNKKVA
jgi:hypothetical protein